MTLPYSRHCGPWDTDKGDTPEPEQDTRPKVTTEPMFREDAADLLAMFESPGTIVALVIYVVRNRQVPYRVAAIRSNGNKSGDHALVDVPWIGVRVLD